MVLPLVRLLLVSGAVVWVPTRATFAEQTDVKGLVKIAPAGERSVAASCGHMTRYLEQIPGTSISFEMIPIPGGEFLLGSPGGEAGRNLDEGPQVRVHVDPFWMGKCEVTWAEYRAYMAMYDVFKSLSQLRPGDEKLDVAPAVRAYLQQQSVEVDGVTSPTPLYDPDTTEMAGGDPDQPAVTMTQYAAKQYTKWLSGVVGRTYRLPSEAEWEYAARAGGTTAYSFGDDPAKLSDFAWFAENSDDLTHSVGSKPSNAWGLHDMHGNVAEWVLDAYVERHYATLASRGTVKSSDAVAWPTQLFPRVIRGGGWFDEPAQCRSAARAGSIDDEWNLSDPNLPKSPWWYTEEPSAAVGFRIIRPLKPIDEPTRQKVWEADVELIRGDVAERLEEGRGARGAVDLRLPAAIDEARSKGILD